MVEPRRYQEPERRYCVREEFTRMPIYDGTVIKRWTYTYSDGDIETVTKRERRK